VSPSPPPHSLLSASPMTEATPPCWHSQRRRRHPPYPGPHRSRRCPTGSSRRLRTPPHLCTSPLLAFSGESLPPSPCSTCSPLLTRARTAPAVAPRRPAHHCELRNHADRGDCTQRTRRVPAHGQPGRQSGPRAQPVANAACRSKRAAECRPKRRLSISFILYSIKYHQKFL
jgi:hypothetical protein